MFQKLSVLTSYRQCDLGIVLRRTKSLHHSTPSCSSSSASESDDAEAKRNEGSEGSGEELRTAFREEEDAKVVQCIVVLLCS